ncbi:MAG: hypothetical protein M1608_09195, partial [Candidatus Omnitrophica bacterium]|nr:hypothetical protein [Candidatus Omnitrophota bacterium]
MNGIGLIFSWAGLLVLMAGPLSLPAQSPLEIQPVTRSGISDRVAGGNGWSGGSQVSADGRWVVFVSQADNLVTNDLSRSKLGSYLDVFVRDLEEGKTVLASVSPTSGGSGNGDSLGASLSANGRYVVFASEASDLVTNDTNNAGDIFIRDLENGQTTLVSVNSTGTGSGNGESTAPAIAPDGRYVAFVSIAGDLVEGDTNGVGDVFVRDTQMGVTTKASVNTGGTNVFESFGEPVITPDGRYVAFVGSKPVSAIDTNSAASEVYVRDMVAKTMSWASSNVVLLFNPPTNAVQAVVRSYQPALSDDGKFLAFKAMRPS